MPPSNIMLTTSACHSPLCERSVVQVPAPVDSFKPQFARSAVDRLEELSVPTTDGLGPLREGQDDFGTVHARWAIHYFQSSLNNPGEWLSLTLAAALIGVYYHSAGMVCSPTLAMMRNRHADEPRYCFWCQLVECWSWIGQAARLSIPLGLNTSGKTGTGPKLVPPRASQLSSLHPESCPDAPCLFRPTSAEDEIDSAERRNLWWLIFSMDTFSSTGSGWSGSLSLADIVRTSCSSTLFRAPALLTSVLGVSFQSTILPTGMPGTTAPPSDVQNPYAPDLLIRTPNIVLSLTFRL